MEKQEAVPPARPLSLSVEMLYSCLRIYAFTLSSLLYFQAPSSAVFAKGTITWKSMWVPSK